MQSIGELLKNINIPEDAAQNPENHVSEITRKSYIISARTQKGDVPIPTSTISQYSYGRPFKDIKILTLKPRNRDFSSPPAKDYNFKKITKPLPSIESQLINYLSDSTDPTSQLSLANKGSQGVKYLHEKLQGKVYEMPDKPQLSRLNQFK